MLPGETEASVRLGRLVRGLSAHEYEINLQPSSRRFLLSHQCNHHKFSLGMNRTIMWFGNACPSLHGSLLHFLQVVYRCVRWVFQKKKNWGWEKQTVGSFYLVIDSP